MPDGEYKHEGWIFVFKQPTVFPHVCEHTWVIEDFATIVQRRINSIYTADD